MARIHFATAAVVGLIAGGACASRTSPQGYPATSAASTYAAEAPTAMVTRSLEGDPPLSADAEGWAGLRGPGAPPAGASGHVGHGAGHHGAPAQAPPPAHDHAQHEPGADSPPAPPPPVHDHGAHP